MSTYRFENKIGSQPAYETDIIKKTHKKSKNVQFEHKEDENEFCFSS
jgi:hypothetical protein